MFSEKDVEVLRYIIKKYEKEYETYSFYRSFSVGSQLETIKEIYIKNGTITVGSNCTILKISQILSNNIPVTMYCIEFPDCPGKNNTLEFTRNDLKNYFILAPETDSNIILADFKDLNLSQKIQCNYIRKFELISENGKSKTEIKQLFLENPSFVVNKTQQYVDLAFCHSKQPLEIEYLVVRMYEFNYDVINTEAIDSLQQNVYYKQSLYGYVKEDKDNVYLVRYDVVFSKGAESLFVTPIKEYYQNAVPVNDTIGFSKYYDSSWDLYAQPI